MNLSNQWNQRPITIGEVHAFQKYEGFMEPLQAEPPIHTIETIGKFIVAPAMIALCLWTMFQMVKWACEGFPCSPF